jgi:LPPG:FO 2-phospho-L-lactate transferase
MMVSLGHEPTARGVADLYGDLVDVFIIDPEDEELAGDIRGAVVCPIVMVEPERRAEVGRKLLEALA